MKLTKNILKKIIVEELKSINENIKVGSKVIVNYPTLTKPVTGVVGQILQSSAGPVYVLKGGKGVWDASYVSLIEANKK